MSLGVCGSILPDEAMQMASELIEGLSEFFLCRTLRESMLAMYVGMCMCMVVGAHDHL